MADSSDSRLKRLLDAVEAKFANASCPFRHTRKALHEWDQVRRIVWVRVPSTFERPKAAGGKLVGNYRFRQILTRLETVEAHIYAEDDGLSDEILDNLLAAIDLTIPQVTFSAYAWKSQEPGEDGQVVQSEHVVLRCVFLLPVIDEITPLRTVAGVSDVCGTLQPNGTITPQPSS